MSLWRMKRCIKQQVRKLSQHLTIRSTTPKAPVSFNVDLLKVPSNYGQFSSRVNRLYNEDRTQVGLLDVDIKQPISVRDEEEPNKGLLKETMRLEDPPYFNSKKFRPEVFNFSIMDGHGGSECSTYLTKHLLENVENLEVSSGTMDQLLEFYKIKIGGYWKRWNRRWSDVLTKSCKLGSILQEKEFSNKNIFQILDEPDIKNQLTDWELFKIRVWMGFLFTDMQFLTWENEVNLKFKKDHGIKEYKEEKNNFNNGLNKFVNSGSTCTSCFIYGIDKDEDDLNGYFYQENVLSRLLIAHIGDTRAILCDKNGVARTLTRDHHPSNPIEANRLRKFSAGLIMTDSFGEERYLNFANTRSFGDITAKNVGVSAEPEFSEFLIGDSSKLKKFKEKNKKLLERNHVLDFGGGDCFVVLITDGVSNHLSDQEIVDLVMANCNNKGVISGNPLSAAQEVVEFIECINGDDNATCSVIRLGGWGKWPMLDRTGKLREEKMMDSTSRSSCM